MAKDLDFDELDKAVNSLMGGVKDDKESVRTENNLDINTTLGPDESPIYTHLGKVAEGIGNETIDKHEQTVSLTDKSEEPVASSSKKNGRFMDLIHKSSDMRSSNESPRKVSHEGTLVPSPEKDNAKLDSVDTTVGNLPSTSAEPISDDEDKNDKEVSIESNSLVSEKAAPMPEPLSSPFLPDAKVEKRPLGGGAASEPRDEDELAPSLLESGSELTALPEHSGADSLPEMKETDFDDEDDEKHTDKKDDEFSKMDAMAEPAQNLGEVNEHIPEEYKNELLAVEQNLAAPLADDEKHIPDSQPVIASIPKQYQEKPSTGESTNGSIFDTDQYHKPLAHPAKEKSGWMWVIVIVILIVVGAALGAAAYFFGLV